MQKVYVDHCDIRLQFSTGDIPRHYSSKTRYIIMQLKLTLSYEIVNMVVLDADIKY